MRRNKMAQGTELHEDTLNPTEAAGIPQLPPLSVDRMNQMELQDFIPYLLKIVSGRTTQLSKDNKPEWWPPDVPWSATKTDIMLQEATWTEMLRNVIRSCYRHLGQEKRLMRGQHQGLQKARRATVRRSNSPLLYPYKRGTPVPQRSRLFAEIYICFFCEEEFTEPDVMRKHQMTCKDRPPDLQQIPNTPPQSKNFGVDPPEMSPVKMNLTEKFSLPSKEVFVKLINIIPKKRAAKILARCRNSLDVECEEIDISEPATPISPSTPRTPKSLISQLSREDSAGSSKKRLSYSEREEDKESVASGCSEESEEKHSQNGNSLLTIDISSLLGQRIQKHVRLESVVQVVDNSETFCKTPVKNTFYEKLRNRPVLFPVTYKPRRKADQRYWHEYCFTKKQKRRQVERLYTGLNEESRKLKQSMQKCTVVVQKLLKKDLRRCLDTKTYREFMGLKPLVKSKESVFPSEPILLSKDVDQLLGLKKRSNMTVKDPLRSQLSLGNIVSEDVNAEVSRQKLTLYRCLLSDVAGLGSTLNRKSSSTDMEKSMKKQLMKEKSNVTSKGKGKANSPSKFAIKTENSSKEWCTPELKPLKVELSPLEDYINARNPSVTLLDDDISLISIESDEESLNSGCCASCKKRKHSQQMPDPLVKLTPVDRSHFQNKSPELKVSNVLSSSSKVPVDVTSQISPSSSSSGITPQTSPCSCRCSPSSELDFIHKSYPSPVSSVDSSSSLKVIPQKVNVKGCLPNESRKKDARKTRSSPLKGKHPVFKSPRSNSMVPKPQRTQINYKKLISLPESCQKACKAVLAMNKAEAQEAMQENRLKNPRTTANNLLKLSPTVSFGTLKNSQGKQAGLSSSTEKFQPRNINSEKLSARRKSVPAKKVVTRAKSVSPKKTGSPTKQSHLSSKTVGQNVPTIPTKQPFQERQQCVKESQQMSHLKRDNLTGSLQNCGPSPKSSPIKKKKTTFDVSLDSLKLIKAKSHLGENMASWEQVGLVSPMRRAVSLSTSLSDGEPIRRSKRLLSCSSSEGGTPTKKLRKIETK